MKLRLRDRFATKAVVDILDVDEVQVGLGRDRNKVRVLRVPLDGVQRVEILRWENAQNDLAPK